MAFAETANLAVKLTLGGNFTSQIAKARSSLQKFDKESRGFKAGAQIGTGIKNSAIIATAAVGALAGALAFSVKQGQDALKVQQLYQQAVAKSGKATATDVQALNDQATALMNLGGVDDELIKTTQTRLIQMGLTGKAVENLTPLVQDLATATGKDLGDATLIVGKAAQGNITALQRMGIILPKTGNKAKDAAAAIKELHRRFDGATKAVSGNFDVRLGALRENLNNIAEDVGIKLLPALTKIVDVVGTKLVPAVGKAVDKLLPSITSGLNDFADALSNGGAEKAIDGISGALGTMADIVRTLATPVEAIVKAFLSLPKEVQTVLVAGFAVNKLTGGLVTNVAGGIVETTAKAIGKAFLGGVKAPLVNVEGAVVNVNGGITGGGGGAGDLIPKAAAAAGGLSTAAIAQIALLAAVPLIPLVAAYFLTKNQSDLPGRKKTAIARGLDPAKVPVTTQPGMQSPIADWANKQRAAAQDLNESSRHIRDAARTLNGADASAARSVASAAMRLDAQPANVTVTVPSKVNVYVTAGGIKRTITYQTRHGRSSGSRNGGQSTSGGDKWSNQ